MRGEQFLSMALGGRIKGSPPHARGAVVAVIVGNLCIGITPACAGSSLHGWRSRSGNRDHPRMRGEQAQYHHQIHHRQGSPPHARGAVDNKVTKSNQSRITPACAGSSLD